MNDVNVYFNDDAPLAFTLTIQQIYIQVFFTMKTSNHMNTAKHYKET